MTDTTAADLASWVGYTWDPIEYQVTRQDIQKYAFSTRERNAVHFDPEAAAAAGYRDVVAPACYYQVMRIGLYNLVPLDQFREDGMLGGGQEFPTEDFDRVLGGETEVQFYEPIVAGDVITMMREIEDITVKQGRSGRLTFVRFHYQFLNQEGRLVTRLRYTRVLIKEAAE